MSLFAMVHHPFVSDGLGLGQFPVGTAESPALGDHIMGVVVIAWLTRFPLERWGESWATCGSMRLRFRAHLTSGLELATSIDHVSGSMSLRVTDSGAQLFATGDATAPALPRLASGSALPSAPTHTTSDYPDPNHREPHHPDPDHPAPNDKAPPTSEGLAGRTLMPLTFDFDAARDLAFVRDQHDAPFWVDRGWAHPAWLASAANAIVKRNVDFPPPGHWVHAGIELTFHAPIVAGATIVLRGFIDELFDRSRHRFAVAGLEATVDGEIAATMRNTFAYATVEPTGSPSR